MTSKHANCVRGFIWSNRARYKDVVERPSVSVGMYDVDGGGTTGEFSVQWIEIGTHGSQRCVTPRLMVFDDAWDALLEFSDLLAKMKEVDGQDITDEQFVEILKGLGISDLTEYPQDYAA